MNCELEQRDGAWYCTNCNGRPLKGDYKRRCQTDNPPVISMLATGPGTELKHLLRKIGIVAKSCKCNSHTKKMDEKGPEWCLKNIDLIVDWLEEEAEDRGLPFTRVGAKILVKWAIRNAKRKHTNAE